LFLQQTRILEHVFVTWSW